MEKNIIVTDEMGRQIGTTYEKRAWGLVKKGRACYTDDATIMMFAEEDTSGYVFHYMEDYNMNYIYFDAKQWSLDTAAKSVGERSFIQDFDGKMTEIFQVGAWDSEVSRIVSEPIALEGATDYTFVFWLNGGENEDNDETCRLEVIFDGDINKINSYKLNRTFIAPTLKVAGWELYAITFTTPEGASVSTELRFTAGKAPMAVMKAEELSAYDGWENDPDLYEEYRPYRANIVFSDGWPSGKEYWYSTACLKELYPEIKPPKRKPKRGNTEEEAKDSKSFDFGKEFTKFAKTIGGSASAFAGKVKSKASEIKNSAYADRASKKTKEAEEKLKVYGSIVGEQVKGFVSDITSTENQEKMKNVIDRVGEAMADAVRKGDEAASAVLSKTKDALNKYRESKKAEQEAKAAAEAEFIAEEMAETVDTIEALEASITAAEDEITALQDRAEALDDEVEALNAEIAKEPEASESKLDEVKALVTEKGEILEKLDALRNKLDTLRAEKAEAAKKAEALSEDEEDK